ncbi:MAG: hypothetical protein U9R42_09215 [Bacteroidota bacterium]|nr:hypothetical protein [Bacteroidota bacterium]
MKNKNLILAIFSLTLFFSFTVSAQKTENKSSFSYDSFEVKSINNIISTVYELISGHAGDRDWVKFKALFCSNAQFTSLKINEKGKEVFFRGGIDDYIAYLKPILKEYDYYEKETGRSIQESGNIAQVFSMFESIMLEDNTPENRKGANCFQLIYKNNRWWIINVLWNNEPRGM